MKIYFEKKDSIVGKRIKDMKITCINIIAWYLVIAMFIIGIAPKVEAGFVSSEIISSTQFDKTQDIKKIQKILEIKAINKRLSQLGFTKDEIQTRLAHLSDQQIHQIALKLDDKHVGQGFDIKALIIFFVLAALLVIILELMGEEHYIGL